ncbi:carboxylating nicotinate-nucleotide diphosphorylase [Corynebacterium ulceribovis]|uniref:carboxylating nicotinate-nucleotide diphosphorylase n=1 Tax=Corynebacterium ulceribovis TaxID=487732 RepID=UPI00036EE8B0
MASNPTNPAKVPAPDSTVPLDRAETDALIRAALDEDLRYGPDATSVATVDESARSVAKIVARKPGVIAGADIPAWTLAQLTDPENFTVESVADGTRVQPGHVVATISAPTRTLLTAERTFLNLITHASGIATATSHWVDAVLGTGARIRDSRKTLPGMRNLQKFAVSVGGGVNHRYGLGDQAMIKDNHVIAAGGVVEALRKVRAAYPDLWCEVEVDTLEQLDAILAERPDQVLLDNFELWQTQIAVQRRDQLSPRTTLESSGGLTLDVARNYATCGVDYLAVGGLTHTVTALDLGLDFED